MARTSSGADYVDADTGNDKINARDGKRDKIDCGRGRDKVTADRKDKLIDCEKVKRKK